MKNVLIVDNDLGFMFWLAETLAGAKYQPWPACSVLEAIDGVACKNWLPPSLLVVNPRLPGVSDLIAHFRRRHPQVKVIAVGAHDEGAVDGVNVWRERPAPGDKTAKQKWVRAVDRVFNRYKRAA